MILQRKLTLVFATAVVAIGAGHFVQSKAQSRKLPATLADNSLNSDDSVIITRASFQPVAAGPQRVDPAPLDPQTRPPSFAAETAPVVETVALQADIAEPPAVARLAPLSDMHCDLQLALSALPGALIGINLLAPCNPDERVVLRHSGLAVSARTSAGGGLVTVLPALQTVAEVQIAFADGQIAKKTQRIVDGEGLRRFAVQWQAEDAFQIHAFENGAGYQSAGHISAAYLGQSGQSGTLHLLGDANTAHPLLAEVYTYGPDTNADLVVEAAVTPETCGREVLGEAIFSDRGRVWASDLTLAMPDCGAVGDILVLKDVVQDMTLAAAQ